MRRLVVPGVVVCAAVALIALLAFGINHQGGNTSIDSQVARRHYPPAPDASVRLPVLGTSTKASIASFRGKVVVLNIFASWCVACQTEAQTFEREQQVLGGGKATVLGVTYEDNSADSMRFMQANHLSYPAIRDVGGDVVRSFGTDAVPETFVLDGAGRVVAVRRFAVDAQWLARSVGRAKALSA